MAASITIITAAPGRSEKELSGGGWRLWLDREAEWKNDNIYLPPVNISAIPVSPRRLLVEYNIQTRPVTQGQEGNFSLRVCQPARRGLCEPETHRLRRYRQYAV